MKHIMKKVLNSASNKQNIYMLLDENGGRSGKNALLKTGDENLCFCLGMIGRLMEISGISSLWHEEIQCEVLLASSLEIF